MANTPGHSSVSSLTARAATPSQAAHTLLRVLDTDQDSRISRDEWRKGWHDGLLTSVLVKERDKAKAEEGTRLRGKRQSNIMELTVAAAAKGIDADALLGLSGDKKKGGGGKGKAKKK